MNISGNWLLAVLVMVATTAAPTINLIKQAISFLRKTGHLVDVLLGSPATAGGPARVALLDRIDAMEEHFRAFKEDMAAFRAMPELVAQLRADHTALESRLAALESVAQPAPLALPPEGVPA
jgi:ribosomal protein S15P/S13E